VIEFVVTVLRTVEQRGRVVVRADDVEDANRRAWKLVANGAVDIDWETTDVVPGIRGWLTVEKEEDDGEGPVGPLGGVPPRGGDRHPRAVP
jgi:hypothetical protein